jgi:hypothetical protein
MNDGMFIAFRAEMQETNSLLRQLLKELQRNSEVLAATHPPNAKPAAVAQEKTVPAVPKRGK